LGATNNSDTPTLYWPISAVNMFNAAARSIYYSADASFQQLVRTQQPTTTPPRKTKFCAFLAGECDKLIYPADAALRSAFFDLMGERYQSCEAIGRCRMSSAARETFTRSRFVGGQSSIELVQPYRFVLSFENMLMPGKPSLNSMRARRRVMCPAGVAGLRAQPGTSPAAAKAAPRTHYCTHRLLQPGTPHTVC
jgi:hypothetical protein